MTIAIGRAIRTGIYIAGKVDRKYNINKIFVEKYVPPGYRNIVNKIFDIGLTGSGIYGLYKALSAEDSPGNSGQIPFQKQPQTTTSKSYKTRRRQTSRYGTRRRKCYEPRRRY